MISNKDAKYLKNVAIPTLKAMKARTQKCREKLEKLKRERAKVFCR
jgi:hypothetical protein